jgi:hypothetical protein
MTRRVVRPQPRYQAEGLAWWHKKLNASHCHTDRSSVLRLMAPCCPYGRPGDTLIPVEHWRAPIEWDHTKPALIPSGTPVWLESNGPAPKEYGVFRHARFMPRHLTASRDEIVSIRAEQLQDISESDAQDEGALFWRAEQDSVAPDVTARSLFSKLWDSVNGPFSWDADPFVWVIEFRVVSP